MKKFLLYSSLIATLASSVSSSVNAANVIEENKEVINEIKKNSSHLVGEEIESAENILKELDTKKDDLSIKNEELQKIQEEKSQKESQSMELQSKQQYLEQTIEEKKALLESAKQEIAKQQEEKKKEEAKKVATSPNTTNGSSNPGVIAPGAMGNKVGGWSFGPDGLIVMESSSRAQQVINGLLGIPGHSNGASNHVSIDPIIDQLTVAEAFWVLHRIEDAGFGQTGSGMAGFDTPESHQTLIDVQVKGRFGGSIYSLLKHWGTYTYGGY